jgi:hypothetical protein
MFSGHVSLVFPPDCQFLTLIVLMFLTLDLKLGLSNVFLSIRLKLYILGRNTTEISTILITSYKLYVLSVMTRYH